MKRKSKTIIKASDPLFLQFPLYSFLLLMSVVMFLPLSCSRKQVIIDKKLLTSSESKSRDLLNRILTINDGSVPFYSARFTFEGIINKKKITSIGNAVYKKNPHQVRFTFLDAVFKSPVTTLIQDRDTVKIYFPVDKTLYVDNAPTLKLNNYTPFDFDFTMMQSITGGQIPLIKNYKIKKELSETGESGEVKNACFLILENTEYFQTISFKNTVPDKILFLKKATREKIELYLENPVMKDGYVFYKTIRLIMVGKGDKIAIFFKTPDFTREPSSRSITTLITGNKTRIIYMNR